MISNPKTKQQGGGGINSYFTYCKTLEEAAVCWCCWINPWGGLTSHCKLFPHEGLFGIILSWMSWIHIVDSAAFHLCSMTTSWDQVDPTWCRDNSVSIANYSVCWNCTFELPSARHLQRHVLISGWVGCVWSGGWDIQLILSDAI